MGVFDALANAIKDLTKTIEDRHNALSDNLQLKALEAKVSSGELTAEQAFENWVSLSKGNMTSCFCTQCGSEISLHEKLDEGFCEFCGAWIVRQEALRGNFSETAIERIDGKDLFAIATSKSVVNMELVKHAAKKKNIDANRMLAGKSIEDSDYQAAYTYAKVAADKGDLDSKVYLLLSAVCINKMAAEKALSQLKSIASSKLQTDDAKKTHTLAIQIITEQLAERERERELAEQQERWRRQALLNSINIPTPSPDPEPVSEHGPLATATNCGMPFIDVSGM